MKIKYLYKDFVKGIKNLIYYFPTIWGDRDWDHGYLENLMYIKFKKWYKEYSSPDLMMSYVGIEKDLQAMRICINILERRKTDWYTDGWYNKYAYKAIYYTTDHNEWKHKGLTDEEEKKNIEWLKKYDKVKERDWQIFCRIFEKYLNRWWD